MTARLRDRRIEAATHQRRLDVEVFLEEHPTWSGCDNCEQDFEQEPGEPCPHCGMPLRAYQRADLVSIAEEYV